jgi:uncharacterized protein (TIRG00374 family)
VKSGILLSLLILAALIIVVVWTVPLNQIGAAVARLRPWQAGVLLATSLGYYLLSTLRWWSVTGMANRPAGFWRLFRVRFAVFGMSYFTLGPQVGGEALQALSLRRSYGLPWTQAVASVLLDKLLELLVNFVLLGVGLTCLAFSVRGLGEVLPAWGWLLLTFAFLPPVLLILLYRGHCPMTAVWRALPFVRANARSVRFLRVTERLAGRFCRRHPGRLCLAFGGSLLAGAVLLADYVLVLNFLGLALPPEKAVTGWWLGWVSLLAPLPGGLGAVEASQVFALGQFGIDAGAALAVAFVVRGRDLVVGGLGLLWGGRAAIQGSPSHVKPSVGPVDRQRRTG